MTEVIERPFPIEAAAGILATLTIYAGASLYFLGQTHLTSVLTPFGVAGVVKPDTTELMVRGVALLPEWVAGMVIAGVLGILCTRYTVGLNKVSDLITLLAFAIPASIPLVGGLVTIRGQFQASDIVPNDRCEGCWEYQTNVQTVVGVPLASDTVNVVVLSNDGAAHLIGWQSVETVRRVKKQGIRQIEAEPSDS